MINFNAMCNKCILSIFLCFSSAMFTLNYGGVTQAVASSEKDVSSTESADSVTPEREMLLFQEVPIVVTPAKVEQTILESPSTITVLTREDIRRYAVTSFADILRNVPGLDVMSVSPTDRNISIRGFNRLSAGKILSLVDSQPIYMDSYGVTLWESLPVSIEEIERIEIIRGPGSALYGENAFDGVINIITDSASAASGATMVAKMNQFGKLDGTIIHNGSKNNTTYKASLGWDRISGWDDEDADNGDNTRFNGSLQYSLSDSSNIHASGSIKESPGDVLILSELEPSRYDTTERYLNLGYDGSRLNCHTFWRRLDSNADACGLAEYRFESDTLDAELQYSFLPAAGNLVTLGANYRFKHANSGILGGSHSQNLLAGYVQDQFRISDNLNLTAGLRYDRHPLSGNSFSPRGSIVYSPTRGHAFRVSAGHAFRNPPLLYSYISMDYSISVPMIPVPIDAKVRGNQALPPERITSFELGYQGILGARIRSSIDVFYNKLSDLITFGFTETYDGGALFSGSLGTVIPSTVSVIKTPDRDAQGGEISASLSITRWLSAHFNYSYQRVTDSKTGEKIDTAPRHKFNPGLYANLGRNSLISLFANYVDRTIWDGVQLDPYVLINSVISYGTGNIEITLSISNILNNRHLEHPEGKEIGRSAVLKLTYQLY